MSEELIAKLEEMRQASRKERRQLPLECVPLGARMADKVAALMGSWRFIIVQSVILALWIAANLMAWKFKWDPYPFILLNLALSFQAAFTAPILMMSQNRQSDIDRKRAEEDYRINIKAEMEIELLHHKMDVLKDEQIKKLIDIIADLEKKVMPNP